MSIDSHTRINEQLLVNGIISVGNTYKRLAAFECFDKCVGVIGFSVALCTKVKYCFSVYKIFSHNLFLINVYYIIAVIYLFKTAF